MQAELIYSAISILLALAVVWGIVSFLRRNRETSDYVRELKRKDDPVEPDGSTGA